MSVGENIRKRRLTLDLTLEDVASRIGVSRQTLSRYETGVIKNIPQDKIDAIATTLNTTGAYLRGYVDYPDGPALTLNDVEKLLKENGIKYESLNEEQREEVLEKFYKTFFISYHSLIDQDRKIVSAEKKLLATVRDICGMTSKNLAMNNIAENWKASRIDIITEFLKSNEKVLKTLISSVDINKNQSSGDKSDN